MALPIRQNLDVLAGLSRTVRAVLCHVVELAENGSKGYCDASNEALGKRTQATARTITRALAELQRRGLLVADGHTSRRQLVATLLLRPCYASATKEACQAATVALGKALSIDKVAIDEPDMSIDIQGVSIDIQGQCLETSEVVPIDISGRAYKEEEKEEKLEENNENASLRFALAEAQKKIEQLQLEVNTWASELYGEPLRDELLTRLEELAAENTRLAALPTKGAQRRRKKEPQPEPLGFEAFWIAYPRHEKRIVAAAAFGQLTPQEQLAATAGARPWFARRTDWIGPKGEDYRPHPATWLNEKRWLELVNPIPQPPIQHGNRNTGAVGAPATRYNTTARGGFGGFAGTPSRSGTQPNGIAPASQPTGGTANPTGGPTGKVG